MQQGKFNKKNEKRKVQYSFFLPGGRFKVQGSKFKVQSSRIICRRHSVNFFLFTFAFLLLYPLSFILAAGRLYPLSFPRLISSIIPKWCLV